MITFACSRCDATFRSVASLVVHAAQAHDVHPTRDLPQPKVYDLGVYGRWVALDDEDDQA